MRAPTPVTSGFFLAFEGGEGAGKSTQIRLLKERLDRHALGVTITREPGGSAIGQHLRRLLLSPETGALSDRTEALLFAADRAEHVATVIRPALAAGNIVITDRYMDSSAAYQGTGRGLRRDEVLDLSMWAAEGLVPDLTVLLDLDPKVGMSRVETTEFGQADRIEAEAASFAHAVRQGFLDLAANEPARYLVVDARLSAETLAAQVWGSVSRLLATGRSANIEQDPAIGISQPA